jgi:hypothetical protein
MFLTTHVKHLFITKEVTVTDQRGQIEVSGHVHHGGCSRNGVINVIFLDFRHGLGLEVVQNVHIFI